jgi:xanthine dehydrogenase accessory factor
MSFILRIEADAKGLLAWRLNCTSIYILKDPPMQAEQSCLFSFHSLPLAVVMGTNEIASAAAVALTRAGYGVVLSHDPFPPVIRRGMAFHDALFDDRAEVDGVEGARAETLLDIAGVLARRDRVAVTPLSFTDLLAFRAADVLIDARMQKARLTPDFRRLARLTVGMGPKFAVDVNCDIAIETQPSSARELVTEGATEEADGVARPLGGVGRERFAYSDRAGTWLTPLDIGMWVPRGFVVGRHDGMPVAAPMDGFLRGVARDGTLMPEGAKILEIDPRKRAACWTGIDERGRKLAAACVKAIRLKTAKRRVRVTLGEATIGVMTPR